MDGISSLEHALMVCYEWYDRIRSSAESKSTIQLDDSFASYFIGWPRNGDIVSLQQRIYRPHSQLRDLV